MSSYIKAATLSLIFPFIFSSVQAQCVNNATPSCAVYSTCFSKYCQCAGADEYFIQYGKKYCESFLGRDDFSNAGVKWRDKTLRCLQEAIVPKLDISENPTCNCKEMRAFAFKSHIQCYLADPSICSLPAADMLRIIKTANLVSVVTDEASREQFKSVLSTCLGSYTGEALEAIQATLEALSD
ncbi:hypothetical protein [Rhizobium ruizarguesonis]|uniref:Uncharacterized protein n=1 Tax=Rhizobium ruizarguesonis TaxID=2081791 RepID=A0AAE8Q4P5_9HYPH|nr:hypothetical protein [Rhizobium ruizarguesonis]TBC12706.1 hypothetical protein ELH35_38030 [Rhizobium ruizarguesonis]TBF00952.1 hypothetical protein ELG94_39445 [Rhizobium ruizarguesonis]